MVEVYLSAQFSQIDGFTAAHTGLLWSKFRSELPLVEQHPPIEHSQEVFTSLKPLRRQLSLQLLDEPPSPRVWFKNESGSQLVQVQSDRFIHNWRKTGDKEVYPRFESIRDRFAADLELFQDFASSEKLGRLLFDQCEICYVNHIPLNDDSGSVGELQKVFGFWAELKEKSFVPEPEYVNVRQRFIINEGGVSVGRLHLNLETVFRVDDNQPLVRLTLLARLSPASDGVKGVIHRLNLGRDWIVRAFADVTTERMHKLWRREP